MHRGYQVDIALLPQEAGREEEGVELPIFQKNGEPYVGMDGKQSTVTVVGNDSKAVREAERQNTQRVIRGGRTRLTPDQLHANRVNVAAAAVVGWNGWEKDGKAWPCTPENVRQLLHTVPHILRQVEEGVASHADFFEKPLTS